MHRDDLRRTQRVKVCCRADVRDRFGIWTAVTEDFCARGCGLITPKLPRVGSLLELTLWSDLFPEPLEVLAEAAWVSDNRVGAAFVEAACRPGALSPPEWLARLVENGRILGPEPIGAEAPRVVPVVVRRPAGAQPFGQRRSAPQDGSPRPEGDASVLVLPVGQR